MMLVIPFTGLAVVVGLERTQRSAPRWRMSLGAMMVAVGAIALLLRGGKEAAVRHKIGSEYVMTYFVGDLLPRHSGSPTQSDMEVVAEPLKSSVPRDEWWPGRRVVMPFCLSSRVIVRDTNVGHAKVQAWLQERRDQLKADAN